MKNRTLWTLLSLALVSRGALACINDRDSDTLAQQGKALPDVVRVVTGRFERNPPLYFQTRIARVAAELKKHPERLALYDDIAVAHDRLGQQDKAINWMNLKRAQLAKSSTRSSDKKEATYRYYANNGTFWAHRWLRAGANRNRINEIKTARNMIAQAIKIKPNAHFGREKYQLMIMDWIVEPRVKGHDGKLFTATLARYIDEKITTADTTQTMGLSGIVVLGNAWESVDIFHALTTNLANNERATLQYLTILRCRELIAKGKRSLRADSQKGDALEQQLEIDNASLNIDVAMGIRVNAQNQAAIETVYKRLRTEAETWQARRTKYMMARLQTGKHPDTDKTFWKAWRDTSPPALDVAWTSERGTNRNSYQKKNVAALIFTFVTLFLVLSGTLFFVRRRRLSS